MNKQQKIVEMAKDICRVKHICTDVCKPISACDALRYAERAVDAGYCKPEWISVDERLPEEDTRVLVYLNLTKLDAMTYTFFDTDRILDGKWIRWRGYISHWMPLPEAPKMKGADNE